jgi:hypothetical protein
MILYVQSSYLILAIGNISGHSGFPNCGAYSASELLFFSLVLGSVVGFLVSVTRQLMTLSPF